VTGPASERGSARRASVSAGLPEFPWDLLEPAKAKAAAHPDGIVDLSIGTPVDPVPAVIQEALAAAANTPGYPQTMGTNMLREALVSHLRRFVGASLGPESVLPTIGSKELVASLPAQLGLGPGDVVVVPLVCYPTYEVGARLAGASVVRSDSVVAGPAPFEPRSRADSLRSPDALTGDELSEPPAWRRAYGAA
jgi:aspartate/methionine/tyrosine aminotransferase